jgi:ArsR family transcriptional regulator
MSDKTEKCCPPPATSEEVSRKQDFDEDELAVYAKALGHPARVAIISLLMRRDGCICGEIVDELPLAQSTVSQHLKKLKSAGLIRGEVDGPRVCYCIEPAAVARFKSLVDELTSVESPSDAR